MALKTSLSGMECWLYTTVICEIPSWQKGAIENLPISQSCPSCDGKPDIFRKFGGL